jgi:ankyrin repeat protein
VDSLLVLRILKSHPHLLQNPDFKPLGLSNTSLHLAASLGHLSLVRTLLALDHERDGISLNEEHQTPLMLAAAAGHTEVVHLLCEKCPSSIARRDIRGRDAIMEAARGGHDTCLQILLHASMYSSSGNSAGSEDEEEEVPALLQNADMDGNTALHFASSNGHLLVLRTLLAAGADSEKRNAWSWTPVAYSATVQAEVYFKGLVAEVEKRKLTKAHALENKTGAGVRMVDGGDV